MDLSQKRNLPKEPLVGHQGVGSRIELKKERNIWILRETTRSQIWKIGLLGLIGFYPMYLMLFQYEKINKQIGETFVNVIMWGAGSIGDYFCLKFLLQLLQNRRIEFNIASQTISFFENRGLASRKIHKNEIQSISLVESDFYSDGTKTINYSVQIQTLSNELIILCTTDQENTAQEFLNSIKMYF
jgi:hypothetical protein